MNIYLIYIRLLPDDEIYTRVEIINELNIANRTFYKYYIEKMEMKPDKIAGKTKFYKGSTVNDISLKLNYSNDFPITLIENNFLNKDFYREIEEHLKIIKNKKTKALKSIKLYDQYSLNEIKSIMNELK